MEFGNGEIERLVKTINPEETRDSIVKDLIKRFSDQSDGIQNKLIDCISKQCKYYKDKRLLVKYQTENKKTTQILVQKTKQEEKIKPYLQIGMEALERFKIITLKAQFLDYKLPIMMMFYSNSYHTDITPLEQFISNKIVELNVSHQATFKEVIHYIWKQTLIDGDKLNYDDKIIIFKNGIYDFRMNKFLKQEEPWLWYYFYEIPHDYKEGDFDCPKFKKALVMWLDEKTEVPYRKGNRIVLLNDVFEALGMCMTINMEFRTSFLNYGEPRCGKSQFFNISTYVIGKQNISNTSLQRMGKNEFGAEGLEFKTLNFCGDLPSKQVEDHGTFKNITGGDVSVESEKKGGQKHTIRPTTKFWFNANKVPKLTNWDDNALYDRFILFHFCNQFLELKENTVNNFWTTIIQDSNEIQGIIHECIEGFKRLLKRGGFRTELKANTKHVWNYSSNNYYSFIYDFCERNKKERIDVDEFQEKFTEEYPGTSKNAITRGLYNLGIEKREGRIKGTKDKGYFYYGIKWKEIEKDEELKKDEKELSENQINMLKGLDKILGGKN